VIYSSYEFLFLFPIFALWFYQFKTADQQKIFLLIASFVFLAWTSIFNLLPVLIVISVALLFFSADRTYKLSTAWVKVIIAILLLNLAYFKYRDFLSENLGVNLPVPSMLMLAIPLGISFYTFEAISGVLDIRRRKQSVRNLDWSLFIMFFPHLIAGPIVRYRTLRPQFDGVKRLLPRNLTVGLHLFAIGYLKKMAADPLGAIIDPVWAVPLQASGTALFLALIGFYVQIYLDFSGYTDMGRGIARALGYRLPINFRAPFFAASPPELYQRWHVSLSSWIRTFVYDPMAMAVMRKVRSRRWQPFAILTVILLVMSLFGLWHGEAWHFVVFGLSLGVTIVGWAAVTRGKQATTVAGRIVSILCLQATWLFSLVLFRCGSLTEAGQFYLGLTRLTEVVYPGLQWSLVALALTIPVQGVEYFVRRRPVARSLRTLRGTWGGAAAMAVILCAAIFVQARIDNNRFAAAVGDGSAQKPGFIYFRF
jgi:D-alanyl-lipoteichoic acid acyltransferase DltB (MBOAT superfamily)